MKLISLAAAATFSLIAFSASASTLYPYEVDKLSSTFTQPGYFKKTYDFDLAFTEPAEVGWSFTELKFKEAINIDFASVLSNLGHDAVRFFDANNVLLASATPFSGTGSADSLSFDTFTTTTNKFKLVVEGYVIGQGPGTKGSYSMEIVAAPVPEPTSLGLALGGVALAGAALSRRRREGAAA